jgi:hypothetical protein
MKLEGGVMSKDVTLKQGDDIVYPRTFARNVYLSGESLEAILAEVEARLKALEESGGSGGGEGTTVVANPSATPTDDLNTVRIGTTVYDVGGIEIIREEE